MTSLVTAPLAKLVPVALQKWHEEHGIGAFSIEGFRAAYRELCSSLAIGMHPVVSGGGMHDGAGTATTLTASHWQVHAQLMQDMPAESPKRAAYGLDLATAHASTRDLLAVLGAMVFDRALQRLRLDGHKLGAQRRSNDDCLACPRRRPPRAIAYAAPCAAPDHIAYCATVLRTTATLQELSLAGCCLSDTSGASILAAVGERSGACPLRELDMRCAAGMVCSAIAHADWPGAWQWQSR